MKIKCKKQVLLQALQTITGVAAQKDIYPILANVKIIAQDDALKLKATDLKISLTYSLSQEEFEILEPGELLISAFKFFNVVKENPDDEVILQKADTFNATIVCSDGKFKILGEEPEKFPPVPEFQEAESLEIQGADFQKLIKKTLFATTTEKTRYNLDNVLVMVLKDQLRFVATDGKRLAVCDRPCNANEALEGKDFTVPSKGLQQIDRVLNATSPEKVKLGLIENQLLFQTDEVVLSTRLADAKFPPYEKVIPKDLPHKAFLKVKDFSSALRRVCWFTDEKNKSIELGFSSDSLKLFANDEGAGEASLEMPVVFEGDPFDIKFNPDFFNDMLKIIDSPEVTVFLKDFASPAMIKDGEDFQYVVLPIKPQEVAGE